ncbi:MAG: hypothetical protein ACYCSO_03955 [Cuniculiplasma sp.]
MATDYIMGQKGGGIADIFGIIASDLSVTEIWTISLMTVLIAIIGTEVYIMLIFTETVDDFI